MQGIGNDFAVFDFTSGCQLPDKDLPDMAVRVCDRHFGIGADGMVLILPSQHADLRMRIFNPDGSEARMCGNATRCIARYAYEHGLVEKKEITLETPSGIVRPSVVLEDGRVSGVVVDMGVPVFDAARVPVVFGEKEVVNAPRTFGGREFRITCVSMGNPHCVIFVDDVDSVPLATLGPLIENDGMFPDKVNVEFAEIEARDRVRVKVWERGAGATLACGTGACATVAAGAIMGLLSRNCSVILPGGKLDIRWATDNHIYMSGPAEEVFRGCIWV
ncbi:MAG TPA: diaminopimelate epimerase [Firmicutes bacterium]|nr:diaminopimelate epimerase [Bacillota bacterium]